MSDDTPPIYSVGQIVYHVADTTTGAGVIKALVDRREYVSYMVEFFAGSEVECLGLSLSPEKVFDDGEWIGCEVEE